MLQHISSFTAICDRLLNITGFLSATYLCKYFLHFNITTKFQVSIRGLVSKETVELTLETSALESLNFTVANLPSSYLAVSCNSNCRIFHRAVLLS